MHLEALKSFIIEFWKELSNYIWKAHSWLMEILMEVKSWK
jgi:hypothetical protein